MSVFYQIYPRSWADSNDDGVGDLPGAVSRLDHLRWLGVDGIWLNPIMPSPNADWGYDVSDYRGVHPDFGTLEDAEALVRAAHERGLRVLFDLVPNHTSARHPWFIDALRGRDAAHRDWYVWADPAADGGPPNNWRAHLGGGSAWTLDESSGQYYFHSFLPEQPDLNWWNPEVRSAFDDILRFWFERGVDGFRIDVVHHLIHDRELRANPPATTDDHEEVRRFGQRPLYTQNRPEVHEILRRWRAIAEEYDPPRLLVGETYIFDLDEMARYFGARDELTHAFNFPFLLSRFVARDLARCVEDTLLSLPEGVSGTWTGSNHDVGRFASRWCGGDERKVRCALMMLLTLPGTTFLYYGDEIGMVDTAVPTERVVDPGGGGVTAGRDVCRTPMHWEGASGAGFTAPGVEPWLPFGDLSTNVAAQRDDPRSTLSLCRRLIALRREDDGLAAGAYGLVALEGGSWSWRRGDVLVALNLADEDAAVPDVDGRIAVATTRERWGERVSGRLVLRSWEGVVVQPER